MAMPMSSQIAQPQPQPPVPAPVPGSQVQVTSMSTSPPTYNPNNNGNANASPSPSSPNGNQYDKPLSRRGPWSPDEDKKLMELISIYGPSNWVKISKSLMTRSPKQCRERYHQNLKPSLNRTPITLEEGELIEKYVGKYGKKWAEISRHLNGRSDNAIKNWWNGGANRRRRSHHKDDFIEKKNNSHNSLVDLNKTALINSSQTAAASAAASGSGSATTMGTTTTGGSVLPTPSTSTSTATSSSSARSSISANSSNGTSASALSTGRAGFEFSRHSLVSHHANTPQTLNTSNGVPGIPVMTPLFPMGGNGANGATGATGVGGVNRISFNTSMFSNDPNQNASMQDSTQLSSAAPDFRFGRSASLDHPHAPHISLPPLNPKRRLLDEQRRHSAAAAAAAGSSQNPIYLSNSNYSHPNLANHPGNSFFITPITSNQPAGGPGSNCNGSPSCYGSPLLLSTANSRNNSFSIHFDLNSSSHSLRRSSIIPPTEFYHKRNLSSNSIQYAPLNSPKQTPARLNSRIIGETLRNEDGEDKTKISVSSLID